MGDRQRRTHEEETAANRIAKATGLSVDDILPVLPGPIDVVEDHHLFSALKRDDAPSGDASDLTPCRESWPMHPYHSAARGPHKSTRVRPRHHR